MFLEEAVQDDGVCIVVSRLQPFLRLFFYTRGREFLVVESVSTPAHKDMATNIELAEELCDVEDILGEEFIEDYHVRFFAEEDIVCQVLNDFSNQH